MKWSRERVIGAIRERHRQGLLTCGGRDHDRPLCAAARRYCGGWHKALMAAGLPSKPRRRWTPELVIAAMHAWQQKGLSITQAWNRDRGLAQAACRYFGTWRKALAAAGIVVPRRRKWTRERVLATLQAGGPGRLPPRHDDVPATVATAVYRYFPTWHDALAAAGLVPQEPRPALPRTWTKDAVLEAIRARHRQGLTLTVTADPGLTSAACRRFGAWSKAMAAAGLAARHYRRWSRDRVLEQLRLLNEQRAFDVSTRLPDRGLMRAADIHFGGWRPALRVAGVLAPDENWRHKRSWSRQRVIQAIQDLHVQGLPLSSKKHSLLAGIARKRFGSWGAAVMAAGITRTSKNHSER